MTPLMNRRRFTRVASMTILTVLFGCQQYSSSSCTLNSSYAAGASNPLSQNVNYTTVTGTENNQMAITIGTCGGTLDIPCASVTICVHGSTTNCQTIDNLLLDTGSYGLRVFSSLSGIQTLIGEGLAPEQVVQAGGPYVGECVSYLDGSSDWGQVYTGDVYLGSAGTSDTDAEASNVPIQLINSTYGSIPSTCTNPDISPAVSGFNGILGVGEFKYDCDPGGNQCELAPQGIYYSCTSSSGSGGSCTDSAMQLADQVQNPVANFPTDYQGIALELPGVPASGAVEASGFAIFGINSQSGSPGSEVDNHPGTGVQMYTADSYGDISTTFDGSNSISFLDSGSNGLYFPGSSSLSTCGGSLSAFFCPCSLTSLTATVNNSAGTLAGTAVTFSISNAQVDFDTNNPNYAFSNLGGNLDGDFDWGLPFFLGHTSYVGYNGSSITINGTSNGVSHLPFFAF